MNNPTAKSARPPLDLGPMGGSQEEVTQKVKNLVRAFSGLFDQDIELAEGPSGATDCSTTIWLNFEDPEVYLVAEHELSHWLFESDTHLLEQFVANVVSKLLNKAGIRPGTDDAMPYETRLQKLIQGVVNVLDDHRVAGLWGTIYAGGEDLLRQRWDAIVRHEHDPLLAAKDMVRFMIMVHHDVEVPNASKDFLDCKPAIKRAFNLVEGVDYVSCLGIAWRFLEEISDVLLHNNPPPKAPPQQKQSKKKKQGKGSGKGESGAGQSSGKKRSRKRNKKRSGIKNRRAEGKQQVQQLAGLVPSRGRAAKQPASEQEGMGNADVKKNEGSYQSGGHSKMAGVKRILRSNDKESDESGMTPLQLAMHNGAQEMEKRIERARSAMLRNKDNPKQARAQIFHGYARVAGIPKVDVEPTRPLPPPSPAGHAAKQALERFRMKKRRKKSHDGSFRPVAFLDALGSGELDRPLFEKKRRVADFHLLFLFDFSGSVAMSGLLPLVERALADCAHAVKAIKCTADIWGYADHLYTFSHPGSLHGAKGLSSGGTRMVQALDAARLWARENPSKRAVLHLTDGFPTSLRSRNSTGNPKQDLRNIMDEIRSKGTPISTLVFRHSILSMDEARTLCDDSFGEGRYGLVGQADDLPHALLTAVSDLARNKIKGRR